MTDEPTSTDPVEPLADQPAEPAASFTQTDVDRIVKDRLARQKQQFADYDEYKAKAERLEEIEASQKSELEKATERAALLEQQVQAATDQAKALALRAAVVSEAAKKNVIDPEAALALLDKAVLEFDDGGAPTNIAEAMDALLTAKPYLVGGAARTPSADLGARGSAPGPKQLTREDIKSMTHVQIAEARAAGLLDDALAGKS